MVTLALDMGVGWISKIDEMPGVGAGNPEAEEPSRTSWQKDIVCTASPTAVVEEP